MGPQSAHRRVLLYAQLGHQVLLALMACSGAAVALMLS